MEFLQSRYNLLSCLCFLLHFSSSLSVYTFPYVYFINCGSASTPFAFLRNFTGDENPANFRRSSAATSSATDDQSLSPTELYRTARIFRKPSFYELDLEEDGTYVVRLHFFPFPSLGNLSDARFRVSASGYSLLPNFSAQDRSFPLVEELLVRAGAGKFKIELNPNGGERSFAFVNAIEVFVAPPDFVRDAPPLVTREGSDGSFNGVLDSPFRVVHRVNVGGGNITRDLDTLMRYWVPDDDYLLHENTAKNKSYTGEIDYQSGGATRMDAPDSVYNTAKEMNLRDGDALNNFNMSWLFEVGEWGQYLVRLHFCDIVSNNTNELNRFNLFIYGGFKREVYPWNLGYQTAVPFYLDFVVASGDSGFMNVSIGLSSGSRDKTAFLNGVEIMEVVRGRGSATGGGGGESSRKRLLIVVGSSVGGSVLVLIAVSALVIVLRKRKRKLKGVGASDWPLVPLHGGSTDSRTTVRTSVTGSPFADLNLGLKIPLSSILFATRKFNPRLVIGEGGFGKVYKGVLRNGTKVAIKRSEPGHGQGLEEFHTEIMVLSKIRHQHLVSLIGYCDEKDEMILVYEFMEKGTLREHLYGSDGESKKPASNSRFLWDQRLRICIGAARGLHYLHTGSSGTIIHRDVKSTNILLDENNVAKVADFGLSRSGLLEQTHVSTEVKGSFGYLDPEYFRCLQLTQKSDVYSFGVVLLEVLCARPAVDTSLPREEVNLADWGLLWQRKGELEKVLDPSLVGKVNPNSLRKFGETVEKCLQECGGDRPNMVDVLWDLEYCLQLQHSAVPNQPYEDSTTEASWGVGMPGVQRLPSQSFEIDDDDDEDGLVNESFSVADSSQLNASEVFSQLNMNGAR